MADLFDRRGIHLFIQTVRFTIAGTLWVLTLVIGTIGLASWTRVFTGDVSFGALDGFQFVGAMYGAAWRVVVAGICCWLSWRTLRWDPGGRRAEAARIRDGLLPIDVERTGIDGRDERVCPLLDARGIVPPADLRRCPLLEARARLERRERFVRQLRPRRMVKLLQPPPVPRRLDVRNVECAGVGAAPPPVPSISEQAPAAA